MIERLSKREIHGGRVICEAGNAYGLVLPALNEGTYGLSQLDNYMYLPRFKFPHTPPVSLCLEAKAAKHDLHGTWGFGLWNDPFSMGFGGGGMSKLLPVLPNAAWYFFGSPPNHLSLRDDLPASGFHMKTFRSPLLPSLLSLLTIPFIPFLLFRLTARLVRRFSKLFVKEAAFAPEIDVEDWHSYCLAWSSERVVFLIDQEETFTTSIAPRGHLGLVIWIDNQYFYWNPKGKLGFGFLPTQEDQAILIRHLTLDQID